MGRPRRSDQTSAVLRREIKGGRFRDVAILPGERQLATSLKVSRTTLRRALAELIDEGLLSQRQGMGTFVNAPNLDAPNLDAPNLDAQSVLKPFEIPLVYMGLNGRIDRTIDISRGLAAPTIEEMMAFGTGPAEDVFRVVRILVAGERPDAVESWSGPSRALPAPPPLGAALPDALCDQAHHPVKKLQRLRIGELNEDDAAHLGAPPGSAAVCLHEAFFTASGACCAINRAVYPAAGFDAVFSIPLPTGEPMHAG